MALVRKIERIEMQLPRPHEAVRATYSVFDEPDGRRYLQIDTYGSEHRLHAGSKTQSIQVDPDSARVLFDILRFEFNLA